ncbi:MAG: hypothetical protein RIS45_196 [Planctomycetota bacterium]
MPLTISIDYDHTFTAAPEKWSRFIGDARRNGHTVVCVTGRREPPDFTRDPPLPYNVPIVCAGPEFKRHAAARAGYHVNIWIDDMPEMIAPTKILDFGE